MDKISICTNCGDTPMHILGHDACFCGCVSYSVDFNKNKVQYSDGDIFNSNCDVILNPVNCVGVMGGGLALAFKNKFPKVYNEYKKVCDSELLAPGVIHYCEDNNPIVVNFPTKDHFKDASKYEYIEHGLKSLKNYLTKFNKNTIVGIPALGCGLGGLDWKQVQRMIKMELFGLDCCLLLFPPK